MKWIVRSVLVIFVIVVATAIVFASGPPARAQPPEVWVDDDFTPATPGWETTHFDNIQDGIDAVASSIVHVSVTTDWAYFESDWLVSPPMPINAASPAPGTLPDWELVDVNPEVARWSMGMAYDSDRQVIVMFGGRDGSSPLADTWEYDGNSWYRVTTLNAPAPRIWHSMAYDSARKRTVLFGGFDLSTFFGDTWEYDGNDWQLITTLHSPPAMSEMCMVYDSCRNTIVLFGGEAYGIEYSDTWEYDGGDWTKVSTPTSPPRGTLAAMAFDSSRCKVVFFGSGVVGDPGPSDAGTWEYDGITWTRVYPTTSPLGRWAHAMAYDAARERVVLFGGYGPTYPSGSQLNDTWEYDGINWSQIDTPASPTARQQHGMAYDSVRGCVVMFGGTAGRGETWEYVPPPPPSPSPIVGGTVVEEDIFEVMMPWLGVVGLIVLVTGAVLVRRLIMS